MGRIGLAFVLAVGLAFASLVAWAQPLAKTAKIGFVNIQSASLVAVNITALREGLRQLGYIEGQNIAIEYRFADGRLDRLPDLTADLLRAQVEVLIVGGTTPAQAVKKSTSTVPIIFVGASDPIEAGLVVSFARPGGNATGLSTAHEDGFAGKWVELLREVVPTAVRAGVIHNPSNPSNVRYWRDIQAAAHGLRVRSLEVRTVESLDRVLITLAQEHNDGRSWRLILSCLRTVRGLSKPRISKSWRRSTDSECSSREADSCRMAQSFPRCIGVPPPTWTRSIGVPSPLICRWSSRQSSSWSST